MSRRGRGNGTVYRRKEGRYEAACWVSTPQGNKRVRRYAKTLKEAESILVELRQKNDNGILTSSREEKLADYMDYWLLSVKSSIRSRTFVSYETTIRLYLKPGLGNKRLTKLSVADAQLFINNQLRLGQSHRNIQKMRIVLSAVLSHALFEERVVRNVAHYLKIPSYKPKEVQPWTLNQLTDFLSASSKSPYYPIFLLMGFYGLRSGEALGISWSDIDITNKVIHVRKQVEYADHTYKYADLKTQAGRRDLPIVKSVLQVFESLYPTKEGPLPDLVFKTPSGLPIDAGNMRRRFKRLSLDAGLPIINPHHLRHTAATNLKNLQIAPKDVQMILGHAHISTTMQIYQHSDMAGRSEAFEKYELHIALKTDSSRQIKPSTKKAIV
ncbi:MAG: site-specific integrase [Candidatus Microsaccharimonas sp.]